MPRRARLDAELVRRGLARSREHASELVDAGRVTVRGMVARKPATAVEIDAPVVVAEDVDDPGWASRGAYKLLGALEAFEPQGLTVAGRRCLDAGASTGGFTDVLLSREAQKVYAVDVGHGQLAWKLRQDPRVVVLERTNARHLTAELVPEPVSLIVCDASFISLTKVLPAALALAAPGAHLVALIKPQFEVGKGRVGKGGVVRDPELHREVCDTISAWVAGLPGWRVIGLTESPIKGPEGNTEFLIGAAYADS